MTTWSAYRRNPHFGEIRKAEIRKAFSDLPGAITFRIAENNADFFIRNQLAVIVEMDLSPVGKRYAQWMAVPRTFADDIEPDIFASILNSHFDRTFRPWKYSDKPAIPRFDLFPTIARIERWVGKMRSRMP